MPARRDPGAAQARKSIAASLRATRAKSRSVRDVYRSWHAQMFGRTSPRSVPTYRMVWMFVPMFASRLTERGVFASMDQHCARVVMFVIASLKAVDWLHDTLEAHGVPEERGRHRALEIASRRLSIAFGEEQVERVLEPLRRQLLASRRPHYDAVRTLLTGDADHVLPYVVHRVFREHLRLKAVDAEDRIGTVIELVFHQPLARRPGREVDAIRKRVRRLQTNLKPSAKQQLGYSIACGRWDAFLARTLAIPMPQGSLGETFRTTDIEIREHLSGDAPPA